MTLRLYCDHDSSNRHVVAALRRHGIDVFTTYDADRRQESDANQLAFATEQRRVLYTANCGDFAALHARWLRDGRSHSGLILRATQRLSTTAQIRGLRRICENPDFGDGTNLFGYLESWL